MFRDSRLGALTVCALVLAVGTALADGVTKSFKIAGVGVGTDGLPFPGQPARPHWIVGTATHLGLHYGEGTVKNDSATFNDDGTITGEFGSGDPFVFEGANGNKLTCYYGRTDKGADNPGTFTLYPVGPPGSTSPPGSPSSSRWGMRAPESSRASPVAGSCTPTARLSNWAPMTRSCTPGTGKAS